MSAVTRDEGLAVLALSLGNCRWTGGDNTVRAYLVELLARLWTGDADAKYGMIGDSDWQYDLYEPLRDAGLIPAWLDGHGVGYRLNHTVRLEDQQRADALIWAAIRALGPASSGADEISDGYHTFGELYDHRRALTAVLASAAAGDAKSWRSKAHHPDDDEPMFEGHFVVGIELPTGMIRYHYGLTHWDDFPAVPELEHAPKWDGATPADTVTRCLELARLVAEPDG
jgi:hypothetical protein